MHSNSVILYELPATLEIPSIRPGPEVLMTGSQKEVERHHSEARLAVLRERAWLKYLAENAHRSGFVVGLEQVFKQAYEEGFEQGFKQGFKRELVAVRIRVCQRMLGEPLLTDDDMRRKPLEQLTESATELEQRLFACQQSRRGCEGA